MTKPVKKTSHKKALFIIIPSVFLYALIQFGLINSTRIAEQFEYCSFKPTAQIAQLVTDSGMNDRGKFYFYITQPQIDGKDAFNQHCPDDETEENVVFGCYTRQPDDRIYIYNITDSKVKDIVSVTAAHEMLHAVYERMNSGERNKIDKMLKDQLAKTTDPDLLATVKFYDKFEPGERYNELHSIFGTEVAQLSPELEKYYDKYFSNRSKVVEQAAKYKKVIDDMKAQEEQLNAQLETLKNEIDAQEAAYTAAADQLSRDISNFNSCADTVGCFSSMSRFNSQRANLLARESALDAQYDAINQTIDEYNAVVEKYNALGTEAKKLMQSIDSRAPAMATD